MFKKLIRGLITLFGATFGYGFCLLLRYWVEKGGVDVNKYFTATQQTGIAITIAIIFGILFFKLAPAFGKQSTKVANNIEHDLRGISGNTIFSGTIGLIAGLLIAFLITQIFAIITNRYIYAFIVIITYFVFGYLGVVIATMKGKEMFGNANPAKKQAPEQGQGGIFAKGGKKKSDAIPKIFDTSVIIDGRIAEIMSLPLFRKSEKAK